MNVKEIKEVLSENNISPLKRLGQNFLIDLNVVDKILSKISEKDVIVEVGPGLGSLTFKMAKKCKKVVAIEKDKKFVEILKREKYSNLEIIEKDILQSKDLIPSGRYKVVSNLPFYITSAVIRMFLELDNPPEEMILLMQKEVAKRICSTPNNMSILAVSVQVYSTPKILFNVSRGSFWPSPNVDSAVVSIKKDSRKIDDVSLFFKIVKAGFSHPRAQLLNNLSKSLKLDKDFVKKKMKLVNIRPEQRAETLTVQDWINLSRKIK
jgi:16S rRNA (adenine1518-N6/adenine1519-N6)-dimethyltransferase